MRSKWLDWQPHSEIMEKTAGTEATKPTKPSFVSFVSPQQQAFSITREASPPQIIERSSGPEATKPTKPPSSSNDVPSVPSGVLLLAPRYDGANKPLSSIPKCWCCKVSWELDKLAESKGKTYAFLKPGCGCLDARMCYACFICRDHCRCPKPSTNTAETFLEGRTDTESKE